jgi:anthranilate phosphoribosyltransferase
MFAPAFHAATRHAAGPRKELGTRTIFNLLGPMTNPAGVRNQVVGVYDAAWCEPVARALGLLGSRHVFVVHGQGGLDEIAVRGATHVAEWQGGALRVHEWTPADFRLDEADPEGLRGGDAAHNAAMLRGVLGGDRTPVRTAALLAAGAALLAAGAARDRQEGAERAAAAIDRGDAARTLALWARLSHEA